MNALANSQSGSSRSSSASASRTARARSPSAATPARRRTRSGSEIIADPPDILLTNYVMLELILTRPDERELVEAAQGLRFLVLDELHTYRGRQGADVALLVRRDREAVRGRRAPARRHVGHAAPGRHDSTSRGRRSPDVASLPLRRAASSRATSSARRSGARRRSRDLHDAAFAEALRERARLDPKRRLPRTPPRSSPTRSRRWIESDVRAATEKPAPAGWSGRDPRPISGPGRRARRCSPTLTGVDEERCAAAIQDQLLAGYGVTQPDTGFPVFAFRLHQFFSRGDTVFATPRARGRALPHVQPQQFVPGDRDAAPPAARLLPRVRPGLLHGPRWRR